MTSFSKPVKNERPTSSCSNEAKTKLVSVVDKKLVPLKQKKPSEQPKKNTTATSTLKKTLLEKSPDQNPCK